MNAPILWYFADPMCSWCWGFSPVIESLRDTYGDRMKIALVLGGLRHETAPLTAAGREEILHHWREVHARTGQPFRFEHALPEGFVYDTEPACRAVVTVGGLDPALIFPLFKAIQNAFYVEGRDVTLPSVLAELTAELGIDRNAFLPAYDSDAARAKTQAHFKQTRQGRRARLSRADPAAGHAADPAQQRLPAAGRAARGDRGATRRMMQHALALLLALGGLFTAGAGADPLPPMIDAHAHYSAPDAAAITPAAVIARLDTAGVRRLVLTSSPPQLAQQLYRHAPDRIIPLLGVYASDLHKGNWVHDAGLPARVATQLKEGAWAGIGELHLFADDAPQPVFAQLVRLAAAHQLVVMIHGDAAVVEQAFAVAPGVRVLWAHLGTDPRPDLLAAMLARFPGLWIDTSVRDERIAPGGTLLAEWRALFERHPERFVVAVDTFSVNRWQQYETVVAQIRHWADPLPQPPKGNLLHDNAARLFESFLRLRTRR